eukprot:symbB.v1.2.027562.t1/scaffold2838.1/size69213/3
MLYGGGLCRMKRKDFKTSQYSCCSHGYTVKCISDIGLAIYGLSGQLIVDICVVISQLGFCIAYCVFVAENIQAIIFEQVGGMVSMGQMQSSCKLYGFLGSEQLVYYIILILFPLLIPVTWLRQLKYFAMSNAIASFLVIASVAFMLVILIKRYLEGGVGQNLSMFNWHGTLIYVGTAMYAFEGVAVLLPVEEKMASPEKMPQVVCWTLLLITVLQISFASIAYMNYGAATQSVVTISLGQGQISGGTASVILVQLAWVIEVLLTFPLQLFPAVRILERVCSFRERNSGQKWTKNLIRAATVVLCMMISLFGYTSVDNLVSMIGALGCVPLAITYPALFHYIVVRDFPPCDQEGSQQADSCKSKASTSDLVIVVLGILGTVTATVTAAISWITTDFRFQTCVLRA